jgi:HAD superfamily hydrolase (TIGR01490 family)
MIAALFDCDGTLFSAQFGRGLLKFAAMHGRRGIVWSYYGSLLIPLFLRKLKLVSQETYSRKVIANLAWLIKGMDEKESQSAFEWLVNDYLLSTQQTEVIAKLRAHQAEGHKVVLVSAQFLPTLKLLGKHFNADGVIGTNLEKRGTSFTGRIIPPVITGQDKNMHVREFFSDNHIEVDWKSSYAYADSITDLELLNLVGNPIAVYPDSKLNSIAKSNNWEVIGFPKT